MQRFKGLGEMDAKDLKDTTMNPETRKLIGVSIDEEEPGDTSDLVERLMGKKPELRFQYIQENARFVEELGLGKTTDPLDFSDGDCGHQNLLILLFGGIRQRRVSIF